MTLPYGTVVRHPQGDMLMSLGTTHDHDGIAKTLDMVLLVRVAAYNEDHDLIRVIDTIAFEASRGSSRWVPVPE